LVAMLLATVMLVAVLGVMQLAGAALVLSLMLVFISSAGLTVTLAAIANGIALGAAHPHHMVGAYTTAGDAGSALGPTLAYSLGALVGIGGLYVVGAAVLLMTVAWMAADR
ncbi:MAG: hypothetical protein N2439_09935, partial [Anaerolineae bacterium]|nr:hypothetical protein [Anaerolineae bacterium]